MHLAFQAHVGQALGHHLRFGRQPGARGLGQFAQDRIDGRRRIRCLEPHRMAAHLLERQRRGEEAQCRGRTGRRRDQHLLHAEHARHLGGMRRTGAAEAHHGVGARVPALLHDMDARRGGHVLHHHAVDAPRRVDRAEAELSAHVRQRALRRVAIQRHAAAEEEAGIVIAQQQIGVGHRRFRAAARVARRPRIGARRMRADAQQSHLVDRGDRAAAGADLDHVDDRRLDRQAGAFLEAVHARRLHHRCDLGAAVLDQAGLRRGAAHVERDHVRLAGGGTEECGGEAAAGGAALQHADREVARGLGRQQAAGGVHEPQLAAEAARVQLAFQLRDVAAHQRLHVGVGAGGVAALVFPQLGDDVG